MGYQTGKFAGKGQVLAEDLGPGQVQITHLDPALFLQVKSLNTHNHGGIDSQQLNGATAILPASITSNQLATASATSSKVSLSSSFLTSSATDTTTAQTFSVLTGMSVAITPTVASYAYVFFSGGFAVNQIGGYKIQLQVFKDGAAQGQLVEMYSQVANFSFYGGASARVALTAGTSQTIDVRFNLQPNNGAIASSFNKNCVVFLASQ